MTELRTMEDIIEIVENASPSSRRRLAATLLLADLDVETGNGDGPAGDPLTFEQRTERNFQIITGLLLDQSRNIEEQGQNIRELTETTKDLTEITKEQSRNIATLSRQMNILGGRFLGRDTEARSVSRVREHLNVAYRGLRGPRLLYAQHGVTERDPDYTELVRDAFQSGVIDESEQRRLLRTDMVFSARLSGVTKMFAVEVSNTLGRDDVDRAVRSVRLLSRVFSGKNGPESGYSYGEVEAHAIVTGVVVPEPVRAHAVSEDVAVLVVRVPPLDGDDQEETQE